MIKVVCAVIYNGKNEVFIAKRKVEKTMGGKWEFPGGKIEDGEKAEEALQRELKEELGMKIKVQQYFGENLHRYNKVLIKLIAFECEFLSATFEMTDHDKYLWVKPSELTTFNLSEADIPIAEELKKKNK